MTAGESHARWLARRLERCGCGRWIRIGGECGCHGRVVERRPVREGDVVVCGTMAPRATIATMAERRQTRAAQAEAPFDVGLPEVGRWMSLLDAGLLRGVAEELDKWGGSETMVHLPLRARPELAEVVAVLLNGMVDGLEAAALMLKCLPKLLLHRDAVRKHGASSVIRRRLTMLMKGQVQELLTSVKLERAGTKRVGTKRRREGEIDGLGKVRELAREGALSKAIKRLDKVEVAQYEKEEALRWAAELIPTTPTGAERLGVRELTDAERRQLRGVGTCADGIAAAEDDETRVTVEPVVETEGEGKKKKEPPKLGAYAEGVRFAALSAPGPSGLRPEHLRELGMCRRARSRQAFERAMGRFVAAGVRGELPAVAWWITDSAVTFVRKPGATLDAAPRPLRVGEVLRRWIAKRVAAAEKGRMQRLFARRRQFGVACPGGAEVLLHHRRVTCGGSVGAEVGDWDVDLKNCYGNLFWSAIDLSVEKHIPGALPWTRWLHGGRSRVILPGGVLHTTDRGAEQGDPLGGAYAAAVLVEVCEEAERLAQDARRQLVGQSYTHETMARLMSAFWRAVGESWGVEQVELGKDRFQALKACTERGLSTDAWDGSEVGARKMEQGSKLKAMDAWYIDDGHIRGHMVDGDVWLMAFDACGTGAGIVRSGTKSLFGCAVSGAPTPPYTAATCRRREDGAIVKYLGVEIGNERAQFDAKVEELKTLQQKIRRIDDPVLELLLTQQCADVGKVIHLLRAVGPDLGEAGGLRLEALGRMDEVMRGAVSSIVRADVTDEAAQQAAWGLKLGGLGLRAGSAIALPAHLASLVEARPYVDWLADEAQARGIPAALRIGDVLERARETLVHGEGDLMEKLGEDIELAEETTERKANAILQHLEPTGRQRPRRNEEASDGREEGRRGKEDEGDGSGGKGGRLQHCLVEAIEREQVEMVLTGLRAKTDRPGITRYLRLADLCSKSTKHGWLGAANLAHGYVLKPDQFITNLRLRLGLPVLDYEGVAPCAECDKPFSAEDIGNHAMCCAKGRSVEGHNRIRDHLADLARIVDSSTSIEEPCAAATASVARKRPADILTSASFIGGVGSVAIDVGVACPHTEEAIRRVGVDVLDAYWRKKKDKYERMTKEAGWEYYPVILSSYGRPHDEAVRAIHRLTMAAARRFGVEDGGKIECAWWRNCSTLVAERVANMVRKCSPTVQLPRVLGGVDHEEVPVRPRGGNGHIDKVVVGADGPSGGQGESE